MNITEELSFYTQIHTSYSNREQRQALRLKPRRIMSFDYLALKPWQSQYLRAIAYSKQTEEIKAPLWFAAMPAKVDILAGSTTFEVTHDLLWHYRDIGNVLLWYSDDYGGNYYKLRHIAVDGTLQIDKKLSFDWKAGKTIILPVAWATLKQEGSYNISSSVIGDTKLSYEFLVSYDTPDQLTAYDEFHDESLTQLWGRGIPKTYKGLEVFMIPPSWTKDPTASFSRNANRLDNKTGVFFYDLKSQDPTETIDIEYLGLSRPEINNLQRFFTRCKGRWKSFYAPTWMHDFELQEDALPGQSFFYAKWPLYFKYYTGKKRSIVVFMKDGTGFILDVAGYALDQTERYGKVYLETPLKTPLRRGEIQKMSFLCRYRHDNDTMVTDYDTQELATTSFRFAEVVD